MSQFKHNASGVIAQPVPLFASSWAALFALLRHGLDKARADEAVSAGSPKSGTPRND